MGKDSTATAILAKENGHRIDRIITVMPDPFKQEDILLEAFQDYMGMSVEVLPGPKFEDYFFMKKGPRSPHCGTIYGWPLAVFKTCARVLKIDVMKKVKADSFYVGIAKGEDRNVPAPNESLLLKYGIDEAGARDICEGFGLLNPLYKHFKRLGCVRCPKQGRVALEKVAELEPEKFAWMIENDHLSPVPFKPGKTLHQYLNRRSA